MDMIVEEGNKDMKENEGENEVWELDEERNRTDIEIQDEKEEFWDEEWETDVEEKMNMTKYLDEEVEEEVRLDEIDEHEDWETEGELMGNAKEKTEVEEPEELGRNKWEEVVEGREEEKKKKRSLKMTLRLCSYCKNYPIVGWIECDRCRKRCCDKCIKIKDRKK